MMSMILLLHGIQIPVVFVLSVLVSSSLIPHNSIEERLGLIRARILGGNEAAGDMIAFLDAHCRVNTNWLETPYRLIMEVGVNGVDDE